MLKSEVDLGEKLVIRLRTAKQREGMAKTQPKVRVIPLPEWVIQPLGNQIKRMAGEFVFPFLINPARQFDRILKQAGIPKFDALGHKLTGHSFRHTYATLMAESIGHNSFILKAILGHERISTTERYCHPTAPVLTVAFGNFGQSDMGPQGV
jgi:integrase